MSANVTVVLGKPLLAVNGVQTYLNGANYPWKNYADFGEIASQSNRGSDRVVNCQREIDGDFQRFAAQGLTAVRWFLFTDGRNGIQFDPVNKLPTGLAPGVLQDMDIALAIARAHGIRIIFSVLNYAVMAMKPNAGQESHPEILISASGRQAFLRNIFAPMLAHYAHEDSILAWEVMNEPEFVISDFHNLRDHPKDSCEGKRLETRIINSKYMQSSSDE
jgi:hypothetical protein